MRGIVSASTRLPASARAAAIGVVCSSSSSTSIPSARSSSASVARATRVVLFVTNRSAVAGARAAPHGLGGAGDRLPGDVQHTVDVKENCRHGRRVYSGHALGRPSPAPRSSCASRVRAGPAGSTRRRPRRASRPSSTSRPHRRSRSAQKRRVVGKAGPVLRAIAQDERSQWRNSELAIERLVEQLRAALRVERPRRPHEADQGLTGASPRAEAAALRDQAFAACSVGSKRFLQ